MDKDTRDLYVFGYGLALIIPYLIFFHSLSMGFRFVSVLILLTGFSFVLWVTTKISTIKSKMNVWIYLVHLLIFWRILNHRESLLPFVFLVIAACVLSVAVTNINKLKPVYTVWMKVGHAIGQFITMLVLGSMYFLVFAPVAIFFRITKNDHLDRAIDKSKESYWILREKKEFKPENYLKQF